MRRYEKEFREQAIKLSDEIGPSKTAAQLGINYGTLADWRKKRNQQNRKKDSKEVDTAPLSEREKQLLKENAELSESNGESYKSVTYRTPRRVQKLSFTF